MKIYQVGGAVRDTLLGIKPKDRDWIVVGSTAQEMHELGYLQVGKDFPVFLHPSTKEEYALARTERKSGRGYTGFTVHASLEVTLQEDLMRRDITINAMALDDMGELIDPYGGASDLKAGILRHVSPAFIEDPLRILRIARFAARFNFRIAAETQRLMEQMVQGGEVEHLVPERICNELLRALGEPTPALFITVLHECQALKVLFPELDQLFGIPQSAAMHPEIDTGQHVLMALNVAARHHASTPARFAVLLHDLGKGITDEALLPEHPGHEERGIPQVARFCERYRIPTAYRDLALLVTRHHLKCHDIMNQTPEQQWALLHALDAMRRPERIDDFLAACAADIQGRAGHEDMAYPQAAHLRRIYACAQNVDSAQIARSGLKGKALGDAIVRARIEAIARLKP